MRHVCINNVWRSRKNAELMSLYKDLDMGAEWPSGRIKRRRPRMSLQDCVAADAQKLLGIRNWKAAAQNREHCLLRLMQALTFHEF